MLFLPRNCSVWVTSGSLLTTILTYSTRKHASLALYPIVKLEHGVFRTRMSKFVTHMCVQRQFVCREGNTWEIRLGSAFQNERFL